jgi:hypothetical protein
MSSPIEIIGKKNGSVKINIDIVEAVGICCRCSANGLNRKGAKNVKKRLFNRRVRRGKQGV